MKKTSWWVRFEKYFYAGGTLFAGVAATAGEGLLGIFLILLASLLVVRLVVLWKVSRMMRATSGEQRAHERAGLDAAQVASGTRLTLVEVDASSRHPAGEVARELLVRRARKLFRLGMLMDAVAGMAFVVIAFGIEQDRADPASAWMVLLTIAIVFVRFLYFRRQFRPMDADFSRPLTHPTFLLARELSRPGVYPLLVALSCLYALFWDSIKSAAAIFVLLAVYLLVLWRWTPDPRPNVRLLVLRVFGVDKNATFTFGRLLEYWQHFGNYFTVVDSSYLKYHYRFWSPRTGVVAALLWAMVSSVYFWPEASGLTISAESFWFDSFVVEWVAVVATLIVIAYEIRQVERRMARSPDDLRQRLARLEARPRGHDLAFKAMPTPCYDDTWRAAVAEFAQVSDVVLMDLRGFSAERKGCEYEVDFLFDTVPVARILFLVDADGDRDVVRRLVADRWERLSVNSPNLGVHHPELRIYAAAAQDELDVQVLLDQLIGMAAVAGVVDVPQAEAQAGPAQPLEGMAS